VAVVSQPAIKTKKEHQGGALMYFHDDDSDWVMWNGQTTIATRLTSHTNIIDVGAPHACANPQMWRCGDTQHLTVFMRPRLPSLVDDGILFYLGLKTK
jgi:hypothetical protein